MDLSDIILNREGATNPHEYYPISTDKNLDAIISGDGRWKLHLPHQYHTITRGGKDGAAGTHENKQIPLSLYNLEADPYESNNVIDQHPEIASKLLKIANAHKVKFDY